MHKILQTTILMAKKITPETGPLPPISLPELTPKQMRWRCPEELFSFETTQELTPIKGIVGQERAIEAIRLGAKLYSHGYNTFVSGVSGTGRLSTVKKILDEVATSTPVLFDFCYVQNFSNTDNPKLLRFPAGQGKMFSKAMDEAISFLRRRIPQLFEEEGFQQKRLSLIDSYQQKEQDLITEFNVRISPSGFVLGRIETDEGIPQTEVFPIINGKPVPISEIDTLVKAKKISAKKADELREKYDTLHDELYSLARLGVKLMQKFRNGLVDFDTTSASLITKTVFDEIRNDFPDTKVNGYLRDVEKDLLANLEIFEPSLGKLPSEATEIKVDENIKEKFAAYSVNVILDNSQSKGAPVIVETLPTFVNLLGTIEKKYDANGFWKTDFTKIKSGSLLRADQGYLVVNALDLLREEGAWQILKKALLYGKLEIQSVDSYFTISQTLLKPEPIELNVKVVMIGDEDLYRALYFSEEDFKKIFKVNAEFDYEIDRSEHMIQYYAHFIHKVCDSENLLHADRSGVAAIVEWGVAHTETQNKLTLQFSDVADLLRESSYHAQLEAIPFVNRKSVNHALRARRRRNEMLDVKIKHQIVQETLMIDTTGERVGQINGLTVYSTGLISFGKPARITATVGAGESNIINIEREVELSGSTHDKGVLILEGFMRERFAQLRPLTLSASIAFEQSYGGIDGDSATAAEIIVLLSALSNLPIKQSLAITGSVNQKGDIQPIGGVNEKIQGFFEICSIRGLQEDQGIIIPLQNVQDLMLSEEVIRAVKDKRFHIYPVSTIEQAAERMMGFPAGNMMKNYTYPDSTIYGLVDKRLAKLHDASDIDDREHTKRVVARNKSKKHDE
ncbi:MAG: AAA family ATPase [Ignavibacteria bacterium]|nr:AAA family ATPase [Ignavibacteria bacterium]